MADATVSRGGETQTPAPPHAASAAPPGYELLEEVGRGGMGVVWRARDLALDREVAVKILQRESTAASSIAQRFVDEARVTAQLQHPGIPPVHHVGTLADGRPFLAMKLIKGQTLDNLLRSRVTVDTLGIFKGISQAVAYAHQHRVIHRDLKPANVMVGAFGEVQVMDWGLAKLLTTPGAERGPVTDPQATTAPTEIRTARDSDTPFTQHGSVLGTPAFMPPEQAAGELDKVDCRSDVFGLGAILCVLLTGEPPYVGDTADVVRLKAVRGQLADCLERIARCGADPGLARLCTQCLAFAPEDRPADAAAVADAVAALRLAAEERARQAERARAAGEARRRTTVWAATAVVAVLTAGIAVSAWQAVRADRERQRADEAAERERQRADGEARAHAEADTQKNRALAQRQAATAAKEFLQSVLLLSTADEQATKERTADPNLSLAAALHYAAKEIDGKFTDQPLIEADLRYTIGRAFEGRGLYDEAKPHLERSLALREKELGADHPDTLRSVAALASLADARGAFTAAETMYHRVLEAREKALGKDDPLTLMAAHNVGSNLSAQHRFEEARPLLQRAADGLTKQFGTTNALTLSALHNLANLHRQTNDFRTAEKLYRQSLEGSERLNGPDHPDTLDTVHNLAGLLEDRGDYKQAETLYRRALAGREKAFGPDHPLTLNAAGNLASVLHRMGAYKEAEPLYRRTLAGREERLGPDHVETLRAANNLGYFLHTTENYQEAEPLYRRALQGREKLLGPDHPDTLNTVGNLGSLLKDLGRPDEAEPLYRRALEGRERVHGPDHPNTLNSVNNLAYFLKTKKDYAGAEAMYRRALAGREKLLGADHPETLTTASNLGALFAATGEFEKAEQFFQKALAGRKKALGPDHPDTLTTAAQLGLVYVDWKRGELAAPLIAEFLEGQRKRIRNPILFAGYLAGFSDQLMKAGQHAAAEKHLRESLAIRQREQPDNWSTFNARSMLGAALLGQKKYDEAEPLLVAGYEGLRERKKTIPPRALDSLKLAADRLIELYRATGRPEKAAEVQSRRDSD